MQCSGFMYAENAIRANILLHPVASDDAPELPNVKAAVFEVRAPLTRTATSLRADVVR